MAAPKKSPPVSVGPYANDLQSRMQGAGSAAIVPGAHPEREVVPPLGNPLKQIPAAVRAIAGKFGRKRSPSHVAGD